MSDLRFPATGRIASIDFGTVRIGVAISDPDRILASPLETYSRKSLAADAEYFRRLADQEAVAGFVVGLPIHLSGDESKKSMEARAFGQWLGEVTGRPICFHDERFTTSEADAMLEQGRLRGKKAKQRRDMLAAQVILASFLSQRSGGTGC